MNSLLIIVSFLFVLYFRETFYLSLKPLFTRSNPEFRKNHRLIQPIYNLRHSFRASQLSWKVDVFSIVKILLLHFVLLGVMSINRDNITEISQVFLLLFLSYLFLDSVVQKEVFKSRDNQLDKQIIAIILLICVANIMGIVVGMEQNVSLGSKLTISIYGLLILIVGLGIRNSVIPERINKNIYQKAEQEFARFTWVSVFVACFGMDSQFGMESYALFILKVLFLESCFRVVGIFTPRLETMVRWQIIYKFAIPISLVSVYGVIMGVFYV